MEVALSVMLSLTESVLLVIAAGALVSVLLFLKDDKDPPAHANDADDR